MAIVFPGVLFAFPLSAVLLPASLLFCFFASSCCFSTFCFFGSFPFLRVCCSASSLLFFLLNISLLCFLLFVFLSLSVLYAICMRVSCLLLFFARQVVLFRLGFLVQLFFLCLNFLIWSLVSRKAHLHNVDKHVTERAAYTPQQGT